jgi:hypothetical protein
MSNKKAKAARKAEVVKPTLATAIRSNIVATYCNALQTQDRSGMLLTTVCDAVYKNCKGKPLPDADRADIVSGIGKQREWSAKSYDVRAAEVNTVLKNYAQLREAIKKLTTATDACTWHQAMALARALNKGDALATAVSNVRKGKQVSAGNPVGRLAAALFAMYKACKGDKRKTVVRMARIAKDDLGIEFRSAAGKVF